ncbi:protein GRIM REAPER [Salvia miltiorrhiza]|uniref:protein GRIM REAPER n=1 Tax=Salvia miltiorrhiza TaxID=226208 RepID=UPI0025AD4423|nr:protein GRIM REAPER [Salvia miltiorrhiza]
MAKTLMLINLVTILFLLIFPLLAVSLEDEEIEGEYYVLDSVPANHSARRSSRYLITSVIKKIKKGTSCDAKTNPNVCNGVSANNGTSLLYCCKKHCRNVLGDRNNCGACGYKCRFGERCCGGVCTNVLANRTNCGKCSKKCPRGVKCDYGYCGYA